ncbi:hypothetical protein CH251_10535 [Rhodococcus sp. 06-462-5]|uniref:SGNH/GDSL hydrolase family protein n=1 Tax=unclassified Rhodococcus (in: high G+C Gram-positive bacteria) TaxID=192944 RepID=UPI000B9A5633|nr:MULTISPECIES: SGNH/GDSL hydrolase family protein [unclassified Rhodococcus (in: high G+C Gram-positive bacteria)]OZC75203.1 hypothetical protein CH251_10535 [Rhodococcus sp. 06-462-5]OZE67722.1 hypothetical protein CH270_08135 [Rhodococcus sp. 02-925g]
MANTDPRAYDRSKVAVGLLVAFTLIAVVAGVVWQNGQFSRTTNEAQSAAAIYTAPPPKPAASVFVIGDSYTAGSLQGGLKRQNWVQRANIGLNEGAYRFTFTSQASLSTGYTRRGPTGYTFQDLFANTPRPLVDLVVVFGGGYDRGMDVDTTSRNLYELIRSRSPEASLVVVGPPSPDPEVPGDILAVRDVLQRNAVAAGATFVDPIAEGWFRGENAKFIGQDGSLPTDEGHQYMADLLAPQIQTAIENRPVDSSE